MNILEEKIKSGDFRGDSKDVREWGGADVIISKNMNDDIENWLGDRVFDNVHDYSAYQKRALITECSKELSWLFYQMRDISECLVDYISKYSFYGFLAQTAIDFIENNESIECRGLLLNVLDAVRGRWDGIA